MEDRTADSHPQPQAGSFERQAGQAQTGITSELVYFLAHNKKWWLAPIILVLLLLGVLIVLGSSAAAPFIYTLF